MPRCLACTLILSAACGRVSEPTAHERAPAPVPKSATAAPTIARPLAAPNSAEHGAPGSKIKHVIVIAMENHDAEQIYEDPVNAPYIRSLVERYAHTENFIDELPL